MWMMKTTTKPRLSVPASFAVLERDLSTVGRLVTGSRSSLSAVYAEMVMFLNGNINHILTEVSALSTEQAPRRLSNTKAEVAALSAGEAGFAGEASVGAACDQYAGEAKSSGEEGVNAGYGDSAGKGSG